MPLKELKKLNKNLEKSSIVIKSFGGFKIESLGKVKVNLKNSKNEISTYFEVVNYNDLLILGLKDCIKLNYRNTTVTVLNYSPAQLLQNRRLRSLVNNLNEECLKSITVDAREDIIKNKNKQIMNYNKNAGKEEKEFYVGQKVYIQNVLNKKWFPGILINKTKYLSQRCK